MIVQQQIARVYRFQSTNYNKTIARFKTIIKWKTRSYKNYIWMSTQRIELKSSKPIPLKYDFSIIFRWGNLLIESMHPQFDLDKWFIVSLENMILDLRVIFKLYRIDICDPVPRIESMIIIKNEKHLISKICKNWICIVLNVKRVTLLMLDRIPLHPNCIYDKCFLPLIVCGLHIEDELLCNIVVELEFLPQVVDRQCVGLYAPNHLYVNKLA